jgi:hypothetical protein
MSGPQIESELKLMADGEAPLRTLATRQPLAAVRLGPARTVDEVDHYLDTTDLRLASQGWACRLRTREGTTLVSLKGPAVHPAGAYVLIDPDARLTVFYIQHMLNSLEPYIHPRIRNIVYSSL